MKEVKITKKQIKEFYNEIVNNTRLWSPIAKQIKSTSLDYFTKAVNKAVEILNRESEYRSNNVLFAKYLRNSSIPVKKGVICLTINRNAGLELTRKYGAYKHTYIY